jgi:peptidyl-tRNA hydrolase
VPKNGTLQKMIEKRAFETAKKIVLKTSHTMMLEEQENSPGRIKKAIEDRAKKIAEEIPKYLWD